MIKPRDPARGLTRMKLNRHGGLRRVSSNRGGFALILVLCFVVLVCLLVLAYMSHSTLNRQISRGSANGSRADFLAQGALDSIVGDLKQEIVAGSTASTTSPPYYTPLAPANAIPYGVGTDAALPNLVKISTTSPFYPGGPTRACSDSTTNSSFNQRFISPARWNQPLLLPPASATDATPPDSFTPPNWILVARDGSNPTTFGSSVIGRYAYVIYNEGGLLDINVAGYPSTATAAQTGKKQSLVYADLTQIPGMTTDAINTLVGWRNNASAQPNGTFPTFTFGDLTNYFRAVDANSTGFLTTFNTSLNGSASDQMFTSRQQLIDFFNDALGASSNASLQNSLQYFGTFSRDLNQPSFTPDPNRPVTSASDTTTAGNNSGGQDSTFNPVLLSIRVTQSFDRNANADPPLPVDNAVVGEPLIKKRFPLNRLAWLTYQGPSASRSTGDADMLALQNDGISQAFLQEGTTANIEKYFGLTWVPDSGTGYWQYDQGMTDSTGANSIGYLSAIRDAGEREPNFFELLKAGLTAGSLGKSATNPNGSAAEAASSAYDQNLDYSILQIGVNIIAQSTTDGYPPRIRFSNGVDVTREFRGVKNLPYFYRLRSDIVISALPSLLPANSPTIAGPPATDATPDIATAPLLETGSYAVFYQPELWNPHDWNPQDANSSLGSPRPTYFRIVVDAAPLDATGSELLPASAATPQTEMSFTNPITGISSPAYSSSMDTFTGNKNPSPNYYVSNASNNTAGAMPTWSGDNTALTFTDNNGSLFREPTLMIEPGLPATSKLALGPDNALQQFYGQGSLLSSYAYPADAAVGAVQGVNCLNDVGQGKGAVPYLGFFVGTGPLRWVQTSGTSSYYMTATQASAVFSASAGTASTYRVQCSVDGTNWMTYDEKYLDPIPVSVTPHLKSSGLDTSPLADSYNNAIGSGIGSGMSLTTADPRTRRFGAVGNFALGPVGAPTSRPYSASPSAAASLLPPSSTTGFLDSYSFWVDQTNNVLMSDRPNASSGVGWVNGTTDTIGLPSVGGWFPNPSSGWLQSGSSIFYRPGLLSQNNSSAVSDGPLWQSATAAASSQFFSDPDGVVRRAMGAYVPVDSTPPSTTVGLPMASTLSNVSGVGYKAPAAQSQSRPIVLNRPFRSVAELGYVFSDTPWRNLDMSTPESGAAPLLDLFCIQQDDNSSPLVAGKVDLNTRQEPVLTAVLAGAYADELATGSEPALSQAEATAIAHLLVTRTSSTDTGKGPLINISELVGKYQSSVATTPAGAINGSASYGGFSDDLSTLYTSGTFADPTKNNIQRFREAAIRPLAAVGTTRVWNLLIDLVAQTGSYPAGASGLSDFFVDGETRYWLHVAIDRQTGQVIDEQLEAVKE